LSIYITHNASINKIFLVINEALTVRWHWPSDDIDLELKMTLTL